MKRLFAITTVVVLCSALFFVVVGAAADMKEKPLKGSWSGKTYSNPSITCADGSLLIVAIGEGHMNITGASDWLSWGCLNTSTGQSTGFAVVTAANGDALYLTSSIQFLDPIKGSWFQTNIIFGGTGRFDGATGSANSEGTFDFTNPPGVWAGTK